MDQTPGKDFFNPISFESCKRILGQMTKNICEIYINNNEKKDGTGFFCKIPIPGNNTIRALITNEHIFNEDFLKQKKKNIKIKTKNMNNPKFIDLSKRKIYKSKLLDLFLIEIFEGTDGIIDFFEIEEIHKNDINKYINSNIYMIYNGEKDLVLSYGNIKKIEKTELTEKTEKITFFHSCYCSGSSSGSPILNFNSNKIIGIQKANNKGVVLDFLRDIISIYPFEKNKSNDSNTKPENLLNQISKKFCEIYINNNIKNGTGFFCKISIPGINNMRALITNKHIFKENFFELKDKNICIKTRGMEHPKSMDLSKRRIYKSQSFDLILIEIFENTDEIKDFFEIEEIFKNNINKYINTPIYMIYNNEKDLQLYYDNIINIYQKENFFTFTHSCKYSGDSSGSPIINFINNKIIGIQTPNNNGIFLDFSKDSIINYTFEANKSSSNVLNSSTTGLLNSIIYTNGFDLSNKKGFLNFGLDESSRLNAIIQMLTSIKEIYEIMDYGEYNKNTIIKFDNIFILTSFLFKAFLEIYKKEEFKENPSLKEMDIILEYLNSNINKQSTSECLLFILGQLHEELLSYPDIIPRQGKLISLENNFGEINMSKNQFYQYYNQTYTKTIISNLFNWIRRAKRTCNVCNQSSFNFQAYPLIVFDIDHIANYMNQYKQQINLDLKTCFQINSMIKYNNNNTNDTCPLCKQNGGSYINYSLQTSPQYFIIVINRHKQISLSYKEEFELPIDGNSDFYYTKYKLIGVIRREGNQFPCIMKNGEYEKNGKRIENWIEFLDEKVNDITIEEGKNNSEQLIKIFHPFNAKVLIYKGYNN